MFDINAKVVCINDSFPDGIHDIYNSLPKKGNLYTVRDLVPGQDFKLRGTCALLLKELINKPNQHGIEPGFQCNRFAEPSEDEITEYNREQELATHLN